MKTFLWCFLFLFSLPAFAGDDFEDKPFDHKKILGEVERELEQGSVQQLGIRADKSFRALFALAAWQLRKEGHNQLATELEVDYGVLYSEYLRSGGTILQDLGDHPPLSEWVAAKYEQLEALLGERVMAFLHLDDIKILNYSIPVVLLRVPDPISKDEYRLHFAGSDAHGGFAGTVTYWGVWAGCQFATSGTGWFLICTPAGMLAEHVMQKRIAPGLSDRVYDRISQ